MKSLHCRYNAKMVLVCYHFQFDNLLSIHNKTRFSANVVLLPHWKFTCKNGTRKKVIHLFHNFVKSFFVRHFNTLSLSQPIIKKFLQIFFFSLVRYQISIVWLYRLNRKRPKLNFYLGFSIYISFQRRDSREKCKYTVECWKLD